MSCSDVGHACVLLHSQVKGAQDGGSAPTTKPGGDYSVDLRAMPTLKSMLDDWDNKIQVCEATVHTARPARC